MLTEYITQGFYCKEEFCVLSVDSVFYYNVGDNLILCLDSNQKPCYANCTNTVNTVTWSFETVFKKQEVMG